MWLHIPCYRSAPEEAALSLDSKSPVLAALCPSVTWNGNSTRPASLRLAWGKAPFLTRLSGLTCTQSALQDSALSWARRFAGEGSECSAGESPASRGPSPASRLATTMAETYGPRLLQSLASTNRHLCLSRTYPASCARLWGCEESDETWSEWVTAWRRASSLRKKSALRIAGKDSLSWATPDTAPDAANAGANVKCRPASLGKQARLWQTPQQPKGGGTGRSGVRKDEPLLDGQARTWPTPREGDPEGSGAIGSLSHRHMLKKRYLCAASLTFSHPAQQNSASGGKSSQPPRRLNPLFVAWLMGFPKQWFIAPMPCELSEMRSYRFRQRGRLSTLLRCCYSETQHDA